MELLPPLNVEFEKSQWKYKKYLAWFYLSSRGIAVSHGKIDIATVSTWRQTAHQHDDVHSVLTWSDRRCFNMRIQCICSISILWLLNISTC